MTAPQAPRWRRLRLPRLPRLPWPRRRWPRFGRPRTRRPALALGAVLLVLLWWGFGGGERRLWPRGQILDAIRFVESGDRSDVPDGDGGKAIGPYQIHRVYWQDAVSAQPALGGDYQQCRDRAYAERIIDAYMAKWVPDDWARGEAEVIARVHNGGPRGASLAATEAYWQRVRARLR
jgi:hypothetical protein